MTIGTPGKRRRRGVGGFKTKREAKVAEAEALRRIRDGVYVEPSRLTVGAYLTEVPGSSRAYVGGVIAYSDEVKRSELGVPAETLQEHGAVSAETAAAMATGAQYTRKKALPRYG